MKITTVYSELYMREIARPHRDQRLADQLRRAHNRIVYGKQKPAVVDADFAEEVTALSQGRATGKRLVIDTGFYNGEMRS